jgi:predicted nucleic acid-binding Zn ribbon protein
MFCKFCKQPLPEDNSICDNMICVYINEKLKHHGLFQFFLIINSSFEKYETALD